VVFRLVYGDEVSVITSEVTSDHPPEGQFKVVESAIGESECSSSEAYSF
jgi:hypothetical protein